MSQDGFIPLQWKELPEEIMKVKAIELFENSKFCSDYYTEEYVKMFSDLKRKEIEAFQAEISDIEYKWYLNL